MSTTQNKYKDLGGILLLIGWILCFSILGLLYHKSLYSAKEATIINNQSEIKIIIEKGQIIIITYKERSKINK